MKIAARCLAVITLLAFARGPALACVALPQTASVTTTDDCSRMPGMAGAPASTKAPASRSCCHPDNLGDRAYVRSAATAVSSIDATAVAVLPVPFVLGRSIAGADLARVVQSHAPPGRLITSLSVLRV